MGYKEESRSKRDITATTKHLHRSPIYKLPSEVLIRIFLLTVQSQSCPVRSDDSYSFTPAIPNHPDSLLLVCSNWHHLAISSRSLWTHIDIVLSCPQSKSFLARAKAYIARSRGTLLDIHIIDPGTHPRYQALWVPESDGDISSDESGDEDQVHSEDGDGDASVTVSVEYGASLDSFRLSIDDFNCLGSAFEPTPIRSLELSTYCEYHMSQLVALEYYLSRCSPGTLAQLLIRTEHPSQEPLGHFIEYGYDGDSLDLSIEDLQKTLDSVVVLHSKGLYPYWTSQAYRGLVDLRLGGGVRISEQQLADILKSSPELQALRLDCQITDPSARENAYGDFEEEPPFDIHLKNLQILDIHSLDYKSTTTLLRRLSYDPNPLRLCLSYVNRDDNISHFLIRSKNLNVTELRVTCGTVGDLEDYTERYPGLRTLVIGEWDNQSPSRSRLLLPKSKLRWYRPGEKCYETRLDTLYVIRLAIPDNELRAIVDYYSVRRLVLWNSLVTAAGGGERPTDDEIALFCPLVENLDGDEPNPVEQ